MKILKWYAVIMMFLSFIISLFNVEGLILMLSVLLEIPMIIYLILSQEVEIIEEEKKIPEKLKDKYCSQISKVELAQKYNEIIDYLDYLKSKGDE